MLALIVSALLGLLALLLASLLGIEVDRNDKPTPTGRFLTGAALVLLTLSITTARYL